MLVVQVAAGVLLGLLAYRGLDSFCKNRNVTMPAGVFLIGTVIAIFIIPIGLVVFVGPPLYSYLSERHLHNRVQLTDDLPPDPPGYFWIRASHRPDNSDKTNPLLKGGHCDRECDTEHPLWLVPVTPKDENTSDRH